jgi:hypothetical protein
MHIIGISGLDRSGKDSLSELYKSNGYFPVGLGDIVRAESRIRHSDASDPISVANMTETANWLRAQQGSDFALKEAITRYDLEISQGQQYKGLILLSVRAPVEVDYILANGGVLIWVEASDDIRYQRTIQNVREGEKHLNFEEFLAKDKLQWEPNTNLPKAVQMNVSYVKSKATHTLPNSSNDKQQFIDSANSLLSLIEKKFQN